MADSLSSVIVAVGRVDVYLSDVKRSHLHIFIKPLNNRSSLIFYGGSSTSFNAIMEKIAERRV